MQDATTYGIKGHWRATRPPWRGSIIHVISMSLMGSSPMRHPVVRPFFGFVGTGGSNLAIQSPCGR